MAEMTLIGAIREAMDEELARDERVFITGEDVGPRGGVFRATIGLYDKYGPNRVIDSPLAELSIVGIGIGAALAGMRPICEIQFADCTAFNQIVNRRRAYYRSNGDWTVPMVIRAPAAVAWWRAVPLAERGAFSPAGAEGNNHFNPADARGLLKPPCATRTRC